MVENDKIMQDKMAEMQAFVSKYAGSSNPALDIMCDRVKEDIEKTFPDSCIVGTRMSEDNNTLSVDIAQVNPDSSEKPWINRDLDECIDSCE